MEGVYHQDIPKNYFPSGMGGWDVLLVRVRRAAFHDAAGGREGGGLYVYVRSMVVARLYMGVVFVRDLRTAYGRTLFFGMGAARVALCDFVVVDSGMEWIVVSAMLSRCRKSGGGG